MGIDEFELLLYSKQTLSWEAAARWFREAAAALPLADMQLSVLPHAADWWNHADKLMLAGGAVLTHQEFSDESNDEGWAMRLYYIDHKIKTGVIGYAPPWPFDELGHSKPWHWLNGLVERLVQTSDADLCFVSGSGSDDREDDRLPSEAEILSQLPGAVTPSMYLGPSHLTPAIRGGLRCLPAFSSQPLGEGWLLRVVDEFADDPAPGFVAEYERLAGRKVRFLRGTLDSPRPATSTAAKTPKRASPRKRR